MAAKKRPARPKIKVLKGIVEVVIEVKFGSKVQVDRVIQSALQQVPTDALENEQDVTVVLQHNGRPPRP